VKFEYVTQRRRAVECKKILDTSDFVCYNEVTVPRLWFARSNVGFLVRGENG
jgi:hypothetical protein